MISIILPVFNRANLIEETLNSIIKQTYKNWECIIIDDGSTDNIVEVLEPILQKDPRFKFYLRPPSIKKGPSACRNYGITLSKGDYIQFFDSDDIMHNDHLNEKVEVLKDTSLDFAFCRLVKFINDFNDKKFLKPTSVIITNNNLLDLIEGRMPLSMVAPMWNKNFLENKNLLDESLILNEDLEFHSRMLVNKPKFVFIDKILIFIRDTSNSITKQHQKSPKIYVDDFIKARKKILNISSQNTDISYAFIIASLAEFRKALAVRDYETCEKLIKFIKSIDGGLERFKRLKIKRIFFMYHVFKRLGRGDTKFKSLLKL